MDAKSDPPPANQNDATTDPKEGKDGKEVTSPEGSEIQDSQGGRGRMGLGHFLEVLRSPGVASLFTIKIVTGE